MGKGSSKSSTNLRLVQGKHNLNANCPKEKLEFKFFFLKPGMVQRNGAKKRQIKILGNKIKPA